MNRKPHPPRHHRLPSPAGGFTLIEMAATLIIISLLMVGQMKGGQMLDIANEKKLEADFRNLTTAIYVYQDIYGAIPGDDAQADRHLLADAGIVGNGNGQIDGRWDDAASTSEASRVRLHLELAGLLEKTSSAISVNVFGRPMGIQSSHGDPALSPIINAAGKGLSGAYALCSRGIPGRLVLSLDTRVDDGDPSKGAMLATPDHGASHASGAAAATTGTDAATDIDPNSEYIVCMGA